MKIESTCLDPPKTFRPAAYEVPRHACDTHAHVVAADESAYPLVANRSYTPVPAPD